jgi:hypothetical protein
MSCQPSERLTSQRTSEEDLQHMAAELWPLIQAQDTVVRQHAAAQLDREGVPRNDLDRLVTELNSANYRARLGEVEAEIRTPYLDA